MDTYYIRHTRTLDVDDATRERLWRERRIAVHFPNYKHGKDPRGNIPKGKPDNASLDLDDYPSRGRRAMRALIELAKSGGYVCAEYYGRRQCMLGLVEPHSTIKLLRGKWGALNENDGRQAILKTLRLTKVTLVNPADFAVIFVGRPRQGTIMRWKRAGTAVEDAVEKRQSIPALGVLSPDQQEIMCSEFLRSESAEEFDLPRLAHLLLPVGRTMKGIDICGITASGIPVFAQVTYLGLEHCQGKLENLRAYNNSDRNSLVLFCSCDKSTLMDGVRIIPLQFVYDTFAATPTGKLWIARAGLIRSGG